MRANIHGRVGSGALTLVFLIGLPLPGASRTNRSGKSSGEPPASPTEILKFVRDRFEVPESVRLAAAPLRESAIRGFYETIVNSDDGKQKRSNDVFITRDGRCFLAGNVFALKVGSNDEIIRCIREATHVSTSTKLMLGPFKRSPYWGFLKANLTAVEGTKTQAGEVFVNGRIVIGAPSADAFAKIVEEALVARQKRVSDKPDQQP